MRILFVFKDVWLINGVLIVKCCLMFLVGYKVLLGLVCVVINILFWFNNCSVSWVIWLCWVKNCCDLVG